MGKNFYIITNDINVVFDFGTHTKIDKEAHQFTIHIGKQDAGKKVLFEKHDFPAKIECLLSRLITYDDHLRIIDDYGNKFTLPDLINQWYASLQNESNIEWGDNTNDYIIDDSGFEWYLREFS